VSIHEPGKEKTPTDNPSFMGLGIEQEFNLLFDFL
jgi:hypothetical protein